MRKLALIIPALILTGCDRWPGELELTTALRECGFQHYEITHVASATQSPIQYHFHSNEAGLSQKQSCLSGTLTKSGHQVPLGLGQLAGIPMVYTQEAADAVAANPPSINVEAAKQ